MRKSRYLMGLAMLGAALVGWASLGTAQPLTLPDLMEPGEEESLVVPSPVMEPEEPQGIPLPGLSEEPIAPVAEPISEPVAPVVEPIAGPTEPVTPVQPTQPIQPYAGGNPTVNVDAMFRESPFTTHSTDQTPGNPTGRQEPAVSIEWIGPVTAKVGVPADYSLIVRNVCTIAVQKVIVQVRVPQGVTVGATEPRAEAADNVLMWEVGTLMPKQEKHLKLGLISPAKGDLACQAWVTFTGSSVMTMQVREPKLMLKAQAPEKALVGDPANFIITVSNPGDHPAERVHLSATLSDGLEHAQGKEVHFDLGNLAPGETRSVQVLCVTTSGGRQTCEVLANADGLEAADSVGVDVIMPQLDIVVDGPKLRYLDRKAMYTFSVTNPGDAVASNVTLTQQMPDGFKFVAADNGGRHDFASRSVQWYLGEIKPGETRDVQLEAMAINIGEHRFVATARASRGLEVSGECITAVEGLSAIMIEVVDIEDPIEVGVDTGYEIRVTNTGSKTETDVKLVCTIPSQMQFKTAQAPTQYQQIGSEIVFEPLPQLAPRADAIYRLVCTATTKGDARFKAQLTSTNLVEPVISQEPTRIYAD